MEDHTLVLFLRRSRQVKVARVLGIRETSGGNNKRAKGNGNQMQKQRQDKNKDLTVGVIY